MKMQIEFNAIKKRLPQSFLVLSKKQQEVTIETLKSLCSIHDIIGILWGGSISRNRVDLYSDVDWFCLCREQTIPKLSQILLPRIKELKNVEIVIEQGRFEWLGQLFTLFLTDDESFSIDIGLVDASNSKHFYWEPEGIILWDHNNIISGNQNKIRHLTGYKRFPFFSSKPILHSVLLLRKIRNNLKRSHLWNCVGYITKLRRNLIFLIRIHILKRDDFLGNPERDIEDFFPEEVLLKLSHTQPQINQSSIARCSFLLTEWIEEIIHCSILRQETDDDYLKNWLMKEIVISKIWLQEFYERVE